MLFAFSLAATLWAAVASPAPESAPAPGPVAAHALASTYDEASCATVRGEGDDWTRAAIGEISVEVLRPDPDECPTPVVTPRAVVASLDCSDPWVSAFVNNLIGTCAVPRSANLPQASVRAGHARHAHLLIDVAEAQSPLAPPPPQRDAEPVLVAACPLLAPPIVAALASSWPSVQLASLARDTLLRPPRA